MYGRTEFHSMSAQTNVVIAVKFAFKFKERLPKLRVPSPKVPGILFDN